MKNGKSGRPAAVKPRKTKMRWAIWCSDCNKWESVTVARTDDRNGARVHYAWVQNERFWVKTVKGPSSGEQ